MSKHPAVESLYTYGVEAEEKLLSTISAYVGEPVVRMSGTFDHLDMESKSAFSELKRRTAEWSYHDDKIKKEGWLVPSCKVIKAWEKLSEGKKVFFFYFWMCDKSLWVYEMKEGDFTAAGSHFVPKNHYDSMLHVKIHQDQWKRLNVDLRHVTFEEDVCWID